MKLSDVIIKYRTENNLSQRRLGEICGISTGYISLIEKEYNPQTGKHMIPTLGMLNKLAIGMGMTVDDLLALCDDMEINLSNKSKMKTKPVSAETSRANEFIDLFSKLSAEQQKMIIAQMKGILANQ